MNEFLFYEECIKALENAKQNIELNLSDIYKPEWFELYKNNEFCNYGKICLSLKEAKRRYKKLHYGV